MIAIDLPETPINQLNPAAVRYHQVEPDSGNTPYHFSSSASANIVLMLPVEDLNQSAAVTIKKYTEELASMLEEAPWTSTFLQTASELNDAKALLPYYKEIYHLVSEGNLRLCNTFIGQLNPSELSDTLLVGLLRLTSDWQDQLPSWNLLLAGAQQELKERGYDSKEVLKGLV